MRLSQKLSLGIILLVGVPVFLLGYFLSRTSIDAIELQTVDRLLSVNQLKQFQFDRWLTGNEGRLELLAQRPLIRDELTRLIQEHATARTDPELSRTHEREHQRLLDDHLLPYVSEGGFERISLLDPVSGEVLLSTERLTEGMIREFEEYFRLGRLATTTQNPYFSITQSKIMMTIATPVISRVGELVAVLAGDLDLAEASAILSQGWDSTNSEDTYIVNLAGRFVTTPRFGEDFSLLGGAQTDGVQRALSGETDTQIYQNYRDVEVIGAYMWIPSRQLAILTEIARSDTIGPISRVQKTLILVSILAGLAAIALGIALARGLVRPARVLVAATKRLGQGDLDHRVLFTSQDEIGQLGHAFNEMAESLKQTTTSRDNLNREVEARTAAEVKLNRTIEALEQSESLFRMLTDSSPVGVFIADHSKLRYTNPAFERIFGYAKEEIIHRLGPLDLTHPADHETSREYIGKCFAGVVGLPPCPFIGVRKDGSFVFCEAMARPIEYDGNPALLGTIVDITLRRQSEEELRLKNTVFESSVAANSTADIDGIITHVNASFLRLWGYASKGEVIGRPLSDFIAHADEAGVIVTALNEIGEWAGDFLARRRDDSSFISNGHATVLRNEAGELIGYQSANLDVTRQRSAETAIRQAKEITDSIIESIPGLFYQIDRNGHFVHWNGVFQKATGYSSDEIPHLHPLDLFRGTDKSVIDVAMKKVFTHGRAEAVAHLITKWGESTPYLFTGALKPINDVPYLLGVGTDISQLMEAEEKFRTLVETTSECLWEVDAELRYTYISPRISDLLGYEPEEVLGKTPFDLMTPEADAQLRDELRDTVRHRESFAGIENASIHKDGHIVVLEKSGRPIINSRGDLEGYRGIDRDITDRKRAAEKLSELLDGLQRSNKELEQFAYVASHDLQEPLRMVASYTQLLERRYKDALDDEARDFIGFAVDGANRMQRLINDLLTFSRIQTKGRAFAAVDLNTVVGHAQANLGAAVDETAALITAESLPEVLGDEAQLLSVFQNLMGNAIKFHSDESPRIHIRARDVGASWEISVSDNGIGINPDFYERIFVIFQRLHTREEYPGTGIGLALCKRIIERHGGRIWVAETKQPGTTLCFTIAKHGKEAA
ncbi:PAS domain S-box protein [Candidatus Bipolaricaulota bacterium]|nr:PAS domain S-box protein [Candidatus Bipolaricaulota bacterium]